MARIFVDYVPDKIILGELVQFHAYEKALRSGIPKNEMPTIPEPTKVRTSKLCLGVFIHSAIYFLLLLSKMLGVVRVQEWLARNRIRTDENSSEPMSCGIHKAYTEYGLARLAQGDVTEAIQSLAYSAKIHPCLHLTSYGLSHVLRNKLLPYAEAVEAIELFDAVSWRFSGQEWYRTKTGANTYKAP